MNQLDFSEFPELSTPRLRLRKLEQTDAAAVHELRSDPAVNAFLDRAVSTGIPDALAHIAKIENLIQNNASIYWVITLKNDQAFAGTICLWNFDIPGQTVEIGYELLPQYQGKGIMAEAIKCVINYAFETLKAKTITAFPAAGNISSVRLLENNGFRLSNAPYQNSHDTVDHMLTYLLDK
ncbi:hypothetical protein TH53_20870 [Pedobacter lusitanus]|uniref:N-acetyltransferase domain-containing protein n=1 Tax=Pedobacter lusitanus TaxID=1503925 RepID=A0A0D0GLZ6_9SPHI|nr:GNAT family N-acetyltransferase [Pedobacter lusitanus]KIO75426.1 hypothetical protein TH53_20870 [Pedobacter lusitanus]